MSQNLHAPALSPSPMPGMRRHTRSVVLWLLILGLGLELCYLALYPLLARGVLRDDPLLRSWSERFPFLAQIYELAEGPLRWLSFSPFLDLERVVGYANVTLLTLGCALLLLLLAFLVGRTRLPLDGSRWLFWLVLPVSALFALTMFWAPITLSLWSRNMVHSWLLGRLVINQQVNPYSVEPAVYEQDMAQVLLRLVPDEGGVLSLPVAGPVWADICILIAQLVGNDVVLMTMAFRCVGFLTLLINSWLVWAILARLRPEWRVGITILVAWNPLLLLLGVALPHYELFAMMMVLLAIYFFLRDAPVLSWCFIMLAGLVDLSCLLLLPLFFRMMTVKVGNIRFRWRLLWWLTLLLLSLIMAGLAYLPFWQGWGLSGWLHSIQQIFWYDQALNSIPAGLQGLLQRLPAYLSWLSAPTAWSVLLLFGLGVYLLIVFWFVDTAETLLWAAAWMWLLFLIVRPVYWPWYTILPVVLILCVGKGRMVMLAYLLLAGGLLCYYFWLWRPVWPGQGLLTVGVPLLLWGWFTFIASTWRAMRGGPPAPDIRTDEDRLGRPRRPPWFSRPWISSPGGRRI